MDSNSNQDKSARLSPKRVSPRRVSPRRVSPGVEYDEHRRHHNRERSRSPRDRSRRGRSRESRFDHKDRDYRDLKDSLSRRSSRDHDRRSYRDRSRERNRSRDRGRERDRSREKYFDGDIDYRDDIPNSTIWVRNLPSNVTESDIRTEANRFQLYPHEVVISRRGAAFVEFKLLSDAVRWKELTNGVLHFGQLQATLHYFAKKDNDRGVKRTDWICVKCGVSNFGKRDQCFKCRMAREESKKLGDEGSEEVSHTPSSTLLFRNLDILTTEERVLNMLGQITVLPIKNLKVAKDSLTNTSRGFAFVELHSIAEAMQLHDLLLTMKGNFFVDGRCITVSYSYKSLTFINSAASKNAATVALAAAQWTNQGAVFSESTIRERQMESVQSLNSAYGNGMTVDLSAYQYDKTSGFYYDPSTGYYYDPNSQYYYNATTQQYLYWDMEKKTYTAVPTAEPSAPSTPAVIEAAATTAKVSLEAVITSPPVLATKKEELKVNNQDKVKIAKKVAKEMEKWAKTLNQKKEKANIVAKAPQEIRPEASSSKTVGGFIAVTLKSETQKQEDLFLMQLAEAESIANGGCTEASGLVAEYGDESDPELEPEVMDEGTRAMELIKEEENKRIDFSKLACLLCKRAFPSADVLAKHVAKSDLHKQNIHVLRLTTLTPHQLKELEKKELLECGYRDRAKERRQKFGQPDLPPPSRLKTKYMKERKEALMAPEPPVEALGSENVGNRMLKAMGWTEGQGLGKKGQGMSGIIEVQRRVKSAGLGMKGAAYGAGASDSYKDTVRKAMHARYNDAA